ncbi:MAG: DNA polymerase III subunit epsilon [Gammaproteobacteria bacterium]|nr:MAG: DNA polymerase III subunit epsilon [Gammaproteobacteria bacterium]
MRQIVLDTETTGLEVSEGHRIIEIGCVELVNRRKTGNSFHYYVQPERPVDPGAFQVHGISDEMLAGKPKFADIAREFLEFVRGAELVIHNAPFDVGFLNQELSLLGEDKGKITDHCSVTCTLEMARRLHPGLKNNLDELCKRYHVDNSQRKLHGAQTDAEILAEVYLAMTGGQVSLLSDAATPGAKAPPIRRVNENRKPLPVIAPDAEELAAHQAQLALLDKASGGNCLWKKLEPDQLLQ